MSRLRALVLVGLFLGHQAAGSPLAAQATPATDLAPGTRVRVRFDCTAKAPYFGSSAAVGGAQGVLPHRDRDRHMAVREAMNAYSKLVYTAG